jgi:hypothetical protein
MEQMKFTIRQTSNMKTWISILIAALVVSVLGLSAYGFQTTSRIHKLERRLDQTNERLQRVEATLKPHAELLGSNLR